MHLLTLHPMHRCVITSEGVTWFISAEGVHVFEDARVVFVARGLREREKTSFKDLVAALRPLEPEEVAAIIATLVEHRIVEISHSHEFDGSNGYMQAEKSF